MRSSSAAGCTPAQCVRPRAPAPVAHPTARPIAHPTAHPIAHPTASTLALADAKYNAVLRSKSKDPFLVKECEVLTKGVWPGVIAFRVKADKATATAWMRACADIVPHITSFGGPQSRTDPWPRVAADCTTTWCRLAVGFLDTSEALITKLRRMLDRWHTTSVEADST